MEDAIFTEMASLALSPEVEYEVLTFLKWSQPYSYRGEALAQLLARRPGLRQQYEKLVSTVDPEMFEVAVVYIPMKCSQLIEVYLRHDPDQALSLYNNNQVAEFIRWYLDGMVDQQTIDEAQAAGGTVEETNEQ